MSRYLDVVAIVEGATEEIFIKTILAPYLGYRNIGIHATQVSKSGQKGGDVRFDRVQNDILRHLKQRADTIVTLFLDYYGIADWPGLNLIHANFTPSQIEQTLKDSTMIKIKELLPDIPIEHRFVPFFVVHEFETLLFSNPETLANGLGVSKDLIEDTINQFKGNLERINNSKETAPSKRLAKWMPTYKKTVTGIPIAKEIGVDQMRSSVPQFDKWLSLLESAANFEWL